MCIICSQYAYEPLSCQDCETAITCKQCYEDWSKQKNNCPQCNSENKPKPVNRLAT